MSVSEFHDGWSYRPEQDPHGRVTAYQRISLPHDAMISTQRAADGTSKKGYFSNGCWEYYKEFDVPSAWQGKRILLEFEGVAVNAQVLCNGTPVITHPYAYSEFTADISPCLHYGKKNVVKVIARSGDDSRWYTGAGIYRAVNLIVSGQVYIRQNGVRISTQALSEERADLMIETELQNDQPAAWCRASVRQELFDGQGCLVHTMETPVTLPSREPVTTSQRISIEKPSVWDVEHPALYRCRTSLCVNGETVDSAETEFGIRIIGLSTYTGLTVNGRTVKLRGTCIHHDNGVIGARACYAADFRKIRKLKENGFNAVRIAHHPASRSILQACDRLGVLVMDELFDMWTIAKSGEDYAKDFPQWWQQDAEAMVRKDYNHPSVILYSIGNEIPDIGVPGGCIHGHRIAKLLRSLDATRFLTQGINGSLTLMNAQNAQPDTRKQDDSQEGADINEMMANMEMHLKTLVNEKIMDGAIEEACAMTDMAGYNYLVERYENDRQKYPDRIIVGSETFPKDIGQIWPLVMENTNLIGDFTWTGWDYLGEAGIGRIKYDGSTLGLGFYGEYPWISGHCGDCDITGYRLPISYYREIVYGLRKEPYIAVGRPQNAGFPTNVSPWGWAAELSSWNFPGYEGMTLSVEVYTGDEEVELRLNDVSLGRIRPVYCKADFKVPYQSGKLVAISYKAGKQTGIYTLRTGTEEVCLRLDAESSSVSMRNKDLIFLNMELTDKEGILHVLKDRRVTLRIEGEAELLGFGSGNPATEERYDGLSHTTYDGRAFAVLRPVACGIVRIVADADGCAAAETVISVD